jgi:L-amino acid N-acyltransferase YncA
MISVRDAGEEDVAAIYEIYAHYVSDPVVCFDLVPPGVEHMRAKHAAITRDMRLPFLVAVYVCGCLNFALSRFFRNPSKQKAKHVSCIDER